MNKITVYRLAALWLLMPLPATTAMASPAPEETASTAAERPEKVFARVNEKVVSARDFEVLYAATIRQRFYHGKPQTGQPETVRKEVTDLLVDRALMLEDAERRGLTPDQSKIDQEIAGYEARYAASPMWKKQREQLLPGLKAQLAQQSLLAQIEQIQRTVPPPGNVAVRAYYDQHPDLFTEPEKLRLSLILLKVDPSASSGVWDQARAEGMAILQRIRNGADFSEMARMHSSDQSSSRGGDLGYVHRGMLPEALHEKIDQARIGEVSEPITTLEGIALVRLDERIVPRLREFLDVEARARELLRRDQEEQASKQALARLRAAARIEILAPAVNDAPPVESDAK